MLFNLLDRSTALESLGRESGVVWDMFHRIQDVEWSSHQVLPGDVTPRERKLLFWAISKTARGSRYLDKLPRNCLRVPYLHSLFPDAWFVFIRRDGRATVSSMMTGWRSKDRFAGKVPPIPLSIDGYDGKSWTFLMPPGWREYATGRSLAEVCAFQWVAANDALLAARDSIDPERWVDVSYESLVDTPRDVAFSLLQALRLPPEQEVLSFAEKLHENISKKALGMPRRDKWRDDNRIEVERILPMIAPTMRRLGYGEDEML